MLTIRPATDADLDRLAALYYEFHEFHVQRMPDRLQRLGGLDHFGGRSMRKSLSRISAADDSAIFVADADGHIVGLAEVHLQADSVKNLAIVRYTYALLQILVVTEAARGQGVGGQLVAAAENWGREQGAHELRLEIWDFEQGPLHFYEKQGYDTLKRTLLKRLDE